MNDATPLSTPSNAGSGGETSAGVVGTHNPIDWAALLAAAGDAVAHAYVPYSNYPVGAAALVDDGRIVQGCNVENASYGLTLCAECGLVSALHSSGAGKLRAFVCVDAEHNVIMPCGRCRQLLSEHAASEMELMTVSGIRSMAEVLPDAFGPSDLHGNAGETQLPEAALDRMAGEAR